MYDPQKDQYNHNEPLNDLTNLIQKLQEYDEFYHPIRLSILLLLLKHQKLVLRDIHKILNVPWGSLKFHVEKLAEKNMIDVTREFVFTSPRIVIYLNPTGMKRYKEFFQTLSILNKLSHDASPQT